MQKKWVVNGDGSNKHDKEGHRRQNLPPVSL